MTAARDYSEKEEKGNFISHSLGILLCLGFVPVMIFNYIKNGSSLEIVGSIVFGLALFHTYTISTLYHFTKDFRRKRILRVWDHISIYFLIGGSYTIFLLKYYFNSSGQLFLFIHWTIILFGVLFKLFYTGRFEKISTALYLVLGWMVVFVYNDMSSQMEMNTNFWLIFGGLMYTIGVIFYLGNRIPYNHTIWHVFVLIGSASHFIAANSELFF